MAIASHDYLGPVLTACSIEVAAETPFQLLLVGVGPDLHALPLGAGGDLYPAPAPLRLLLGSTQLHGVVCEGPLTESTKSRRVAAFGPHGLALCEVSTRPGELHLQAHQQARLPDWPLDVAWMRQSESEAAQQSARKAQPEALLVAYGRNFLEIWQITPALVREARLLGPSEVSFLYSASLQSVGHGDFLCAAGTFDGFVVLWHLSDSLQCGRGEVSPTAPRSQQLMGHQGAIFQLRLFFHGTTLVTASDDRSVRLWSLDSSPIYETEELERPPTPDTTRWSCVSTCRGHGSRVWDALLVPLASGRLSRLGIVSASEDSILRVFSLQGQLLRELQGHQTRGVRCLEVLQDPSTWHGEAGAVISGGEDGAVKLWPLADVGCAEQGRVRLRTWQVPESSDWIREVLVLSHQEALVATNFGRVYKLQVSGAPEVGEEDVVCNLLFEEAGACFTSMGVGNSGAALWIGCADGRGILLQIDSGAEGGLRAVSKVVEVFRQCRVSASFGACDGHGLFCDHAGRVQVFRDLPGSAAPDRLAQKQIATPKKGEKNQRLLCALLLSDPFNTESDLAWLLGDEHGILHLVHLIRPDQFRAVHEGKVLSLAPCGGDFLSSGADGAIVRHRRDLADQAETWTQVAVHRPGCGLKHLSHLVPMDQSEASVPPLFIGAFQSADFVLWDSLAGLEIWRTRCGGAKRPNGLMADERCFTFMFSAGSKVLEIHTTFSDEATRRSTAAQGLRRPLHGREIHQICWLQMPSSKHHGLLATASEDTSLRLLQCGGPPGPFLCPETGTVRFPGSVRALSSCVLDRALDRRDVILLSGGAKGELRAHRRSSDGSDPLSCIWSTSLGKVDPIIEERDESEEEKVDEVLARLEERVMAVSTMKESEDTVLLAAASSSGYLRSWRLQLKSCLECNDVTVEFLQRQQVSNTTALCMEGFQDPDWGVFVGSADGKLAACKLAGSCGPCLDLQLHDAGVNDLALKTLDSQEVLAVLTAGDDHRMGLCHFTLDGELQLASSRLIEAHFSAVRSVCWAESFPLTLGLDRRLRLWNEDQLKAEWVTCCTEPETMVSVTGTENVTGRTLVVLAGRGVELCSVDF